MDNEAWASSEAPLEYHRVLQPLSREHMSGLIQSRNLQHAADGDAHQRRAAVKAFVRVRWAENAPDRRRSPFRR